jgi:hypothetical protein
VATASVAVMVVGGVGKELGLVLHDERCIWSMPRHNRRMGKRWRDSSPKRGCGGGASVKKVKLRWLGEDPWGRAVL